jgi:hypothetical protein
MTPPTARVADWLKLNEWVREQHQRIIDIWDTAGRPFEWDHGVDPLQSIAHGRITPPKAAEEHARQKELGWDVAGNVIAQVEASVAKSRSE